MQKPWIGYGPFYVAESLDLFKKYNLKVSLQIFSDPALIPPAGACGAVDGAMVTYDQVIGQVAAGQPQKVRERRPLAGLRDGERIVGYDNERGKGDHRHIKGHETAYRFVSPEKLVADFLADVHADPAHPDAMALGLALGDVERMAECAHQLRQAQPCGGGLARAQVGAGARQETVHGRRSARRRRT